MTDELPRKRARTKADARAAAWAKVPPVMRATMQDYLAQLATTLRPGRVDNVEATLREFACFVADRDPAARRVADLGRRHVEEYKLWLAQRPAARGGPLHRHTIKDRLCALRGFFTRLIEWDAADAPARVPVLPSDFPIADEPLPRFLDDAAAAKLLQAARADEDPFVRLTVEFLARTGLRKGEYLALATDAVVQIGSAYWLHVPVGKLHTDRYIPLHPQLKELLDDWLARRPEGLRSKLIFVEQGRQIPESRVDAAVAKAAGTAGIGRVSPHRLSLRVARLGQLARPLDHPAFVAETAGGRLPGMLTYVPGQDWQQCEILTLHAGEQWHGAGTALIEAIWHLATRQGCTRGAPACGSLPPTTTLMRCVSTSAAASAW